MINSRALDHKANQLQVCSNQTKFLPLIHNSGPIKILAEVNSANYQNFWDGHINGNYVLIGSDVSWLGYERKSLLIKEINCDKDIVRKLSKNVLKVVLM